MKSKKRSPEQIIKKLLRVGGRQDDRMRSELLEAEVCGNASAAQTLAAAWRSDYNHHRPHDSFGYQTPAEFAARCAVSAPAAPSLQQYSRKPKLPLTQRAKPLVQENGGIPLSATLTAWNNLALVKHSARFRSFESNRMPRTETIELLMVGSSSS